ncbi:MAG: hypothetical protein HYY40_04165 [Bacteroidetes bacterium]|nr:hypothetical protein [Bacteroidota bacterium]
MSDPSGNSTTGIVRRSTTDASFSTDDQVKFTSQGGDNAWPCGDYLNIWVCDLSGGLLGYAQFPGGACNTDGVVIDYLYTGTTGSTPPFDLGRTATHEVGHYLNLRHIWGDANCGSDLVSDTPTHDNSHGGCPTHPYHTNACGGGTSPNGEMFMNYMDYTDDNCMNIFTSGQRTRMRNLFGAGGARLSLLSSQGCVSPVALDAGISAIISPTGTFCATTITPVVTLRN